MIRLDEEGSEEGKGSWYDSQGILLPGFYNWESVKKLTRNGMEKRRNLIKYPALLLTMTSIEETSSCPALQVSDRKLNFSAFVLSRK